MAKALFGYVGLGPDPRLAAEIDRLRRRVQALEKENAHLRAVNERLTDSVGDMLELSVPGSATVVAGEPALA